MTCAGPTADPGVGRHGLASRAGASRAARPLLVLGAGVAVVAFVGQVDPNEPGHYPTCPLLAITGQWCPGCGSLRAVHALAGGDLATALARNPLTVVGLIGLGLMWVVWLRRSLAGQGRLAGRHRTVPAWAWWALLAAVMLFWVLRNVPGFVFLAP
ncbi:MAG: DUF2752 domain-containing protein [Angustibacter sp.]